MMTKDEVIELLQKVEFDENDYVTNVEWQMENGSWTSESCDGLSDILSWIADNHTYRIKGKPKVRPYEAKDWLCFLNKVWLNKDLETVLIIGYNKHILICCGNWDTQPPNSSFLWTVTYEWAFENLTRPDGVPFGEIE